MIWAQSRALTYENYSTVDSMEGGCVCALLFRFFSSIAVVVVALVSLSHCSKGANVVCKLCLCAICEYNPNLAIAKNHLRYIIMHLECITMDKIIVITEQFI